MMHKSLCLTLLLSSLPARAQLNGALADSTQRKPRLTLKGETQPGISRIDGSLNGIIGDSRLLGKHVQSPLPGFGFETGFVGKGTTFAQNHPKIKMLQKLGPNTFVRAQGEIEGEGMVKGDGASNGFFGLQARLAMGKIMKNGVYYLMSAQEDYMLYKGTYHKGNEPMQDAEFRLYGPEVGKEFHLGRNGVVYAGVVAGMGNYSGINGQEIGPDGKERWHMFDRWAPGGGVAIEGRIGKPNTKGTVYFEITSSSYAKANRSNVSVDYSLSKKLSVGAGVNQMYIEDKTGVNQPGIDLLVPYAKLSYGLNR